MTETPDYKRKVEHKHLLIEGFIDRHQDAIKLESLVTELCKVIKAQVMGGPVSYYCDQPPNNMGWTVFLAIKQSHIIIHTWMDYVLMKEQLQIDIYSCKDFDIKDVFKFLKKKEVYNIKYKLINRETELDKNA